MPTVKQRTYPMNVITFARRLHEQNGWGVSRIRHALAKRGHHPTHNTVLCWIDEDYAAQRRERTKLENRRRRGGLKGKRRQTPWGYRLSRMETLREAGVSYAAIARVMGVDFDLELTADQVERILKGKVSGRTIRRLLWPKDSA